MNKYFQKSKFAIIAMIALFAVAHTTRLLAATDILVDETGYTVTTNAADNIRFITPNAIVTANRNIIWYGEIQMNSSGVVHVTYSGMSFTLDGELIGSSDFTKTGNGIFVLDSSSPFDGKIIISEGTFQLGVSGSLPDNAVTLASGATLQIDTDWTIKSLNGSGRVDLGAKILTISGNDDMKFSGMLTGTGGTLKKTGSGLLTFDGTIADNATVDIIVSNGDFSFNNGTIEDNATVSIDVSNGEFSFINNKIEGTAIVDVSVTDGVFVASGIDGTLDKVTVGNGAVFTLENGSNFPETIKIKDLTVDGTLQMRVSDDAVNGKYDRITGLTKLDGSGTIEIDALAGVYGNSTNPSVYKIFRDSSGDPITPTFSGTIDVLQKFLDGQWNSTSHMLEISRIDNYFTNEINIGLSPLTPNRSIIGEALNNTSSPSPWKVMTSISDYWFNNNPAGQADILALYDAMYSPLRANSMILGQWQTSRYGLNHLDLTDCGTSQNNGLWLEIIHQTTDFESDGNSNDYGISRTGFIIGSEERRVDATYGFFVGYSRPFLYAHGDKVEAGDLQFGFYGGSKVNDALETKLFVGYGHQGYTSKRFIDSPILGGLKRIDGKYSGDSMSMSLEFGLPLGGGFFCLRPVFAIDSDLTWQYGFSETGDTGAELWQDRSFLNRSFLRTGLTAQLGSVGHCDTLALLSRFYYGYQAFGDSSPMSRARFTGDPSSNSWMVHGVDPGKDYVNLGVGLHWNIDGNRAFYGDYDFNTTSRSTAHWGTLGYMQRW